MTNKSMDCVTPTNDSRGVERPVSGTVASSMKVKSKLTQWVVTSRGYGPIMEQLQGQCADDWRGFRLDRLVI